MFRVRRRDFALVAAVLAVSGCVVLGGTFDRGTTQVRSAEIATGTPTLPVFVLRMAVTGASLDPTQAALASELARECDRAARPIDEARAVYVEELIHAVEARQFSAPSAEPAAEALVRASAEAAATNDAALEKLHRSLEPWQRRQLAARIRTHFADWSPTWKAGTVEEHGWLDSIATDHLSSSADDERATARRWADALRADVRAAEKLDENGRRELVARLRQAGPK